MKFYTLILCIAVLGFAGCNSETGVVFKSPGEMVELKLNNCENALMYEVSFLGQKLIMSSKMGLSTNLGNLKYGNITSFEVSSKHSQWEPVFGERSLIKDHYSEVLFRFISSDDLEMNIRFRLYDDGLAFRYEIPEQNAITEITVTDDHSQFRFSKDYPSRSMGENIEKAEMKPMLISETTFSKPPVLIDAQNSWVALTEASVFDFSLMYFSNPDAETGFKADIGPSTVSIPAITPWRVILLGEKAGDLIESDILVNLNAPTDKPRFSWVKPGKALWDWRNQGYVADDGFIYHQNEPTIKRLIDFAGSNNIQYLQIDAGWYSEKGPRFPRKDLDIASLIQYGKSKGVDLILYIDRRRDNSVNDWDLEEVLKTFKGWGIAGFKYGFLSGEFAGAHNNKLAKEDRQAFVNMTWEIVELGAKYELLVNFHDNPLHPGGEIRTWPNLIVTEYGHAQQDARKSFGPDKSVTVPFVNGLLGPIDMSNGFYDLDNLQNRIKVDKNGIFSTVVGETARVLVNYTPLLILPDNGDVYSQKDDLFEFIRQMPSTWDESLVLDGKPADFIIIARRSGNRWFVGGNTNENPRKIKIPLDFLPTGDFSITLFMDDHDTHFINNKESYRINTMHADQNTVINAEMAAGGGFCMIISTL